MKSSITTFGNPDADTLLLQMTDEHDLEFMEKEVFCIRELTSRKDFCLKAVKVRDWNHDLSPWPAPAVFGKEDFGDGAGELLAFLREKVLSDQTGPKGQSGKRIYIGGYSLAGLFALWAGYQMDCFDGIAAASPSIWFPHFTEFMREHTMRAERVYLSLGDREEKTRNPVMARVGTAIREAQAILEAAGKDCVLEWNKGNHFQEPDVRTAKAFAWVMNRDGASK